MSKIKVVKNEENPEPTQVLAEAIIKISEAFNELRNSDLNEEAIIVLIVDSCPPVGAGTQRKRISKPTVRAVLKTIRELKGRYCR